MPIATSSRNVRIHYDVHEPHGEPRCAPVVLIQGLGLSSRFWFDLPARLAADPKCPYRVITLDNRGTGRSDKPRGPYRMRDMADDVASVLDAVGARHAIVVGISMGGMIAQSVALRHPQRVDGLVLLATTPGLPHGKLPRLSALAALLTVPFARSRGSRALARLLLPDDAIDRAAEILREWPAAFREHPISAAAFFAQLAAAATHSTGFLLKRVEVPTVIVTGEHDVLIPPVNSEILARRLRRSVLEVVPGAAHALPMTDERVVERALERLEELRVSPPPPDELGSLLDKLGERLGAVFEAVRGLRTAGSH
jgi:pimeloyl-ACP methyl ester carboxylesterase